MRIRPLSILTASLAWPLISIIITLLTTDAEASERRIALVVGNSAYRSVPELANPRNDAADIAARLRNLRFDVVSGVDLDREGLRRAVREFSNKLDQADMAFFYYAGHGLQVSGENYLVPIDAKLESLIDLEFEAVPMNLILAAMERNSKVNIVMLDACRDNPLADSLARSLGTRSGSVSRGLARLGSGVGTLIAFSTQPGNVALDGAGRNSPFTSALLKHLGTPGMDISRELVLVRRDVLEATNGAQVPWENSSLTGEVVLNPSPAVVTGATTAVDLTANEREIEIAYWNSIKDRGTAAYFESYLNRYPSGNFSEIARIRIKELASVAKQPDQLTPPNDSEKDTSGEAPMAPTSLPNTPFEEVTRGGGPGTKSIAERVRVADLGSGTDVRLKKALWRLATYEVSYGVFRGNLYIAVLDPRSNWYEAKRTAEDVGGHLVTIHDSKENRFVYGLFAADVRFVSVGNKGMDKNGPFIGLFQPSGSKEPRGGWRWVTDEPLEYTNWNNGQPNNYGGRGDVGVFYSYGTRSPNEEQRVLRWDDYHGLDRSRGYIIEIEGVPKFDMQTLSAQMERELVRLGCLKGKVDGQWGSASEVALGKFITRRSVRATSLEPSAQLLEALKTAKPGACIQ